LFNWNGAEGKLKYQFTGQEFNDDFGLGWSHHNARFYDAALGRWHSVDLLAEATIGETPYHYCSNNPVNAVDPSGMAGEPTDGNPAPGTQLSRMQHVQMVEIATKRVAKKVITPAVSKDGTKVNKDGKGSKPTKPTKPVDDSQSPIYNYDQDDLDRGMSSFSDYSSTLGDGGYQGTGMGGGSGAALFGSSVTGALAMVTGEPTDMRLFGITVYKPDGSEAAFVSMNAWQPATFPDENRPDVDESSKNDDERWVYEVGRYGANFNEFNISAIFTKTNGRIEDDLNSKSYKKVYTLTANIGISPNFGVEGNSTVGISVGPFNPSMGITKTHTQGIQNFVITWNVEEIFDITGRAFIVVTPNAPLTKEINLDRNSNFFSTKLKFGGHHFTVKTWLETGKKGGSQ
jgi:RHS repeat-associated protein